MRIYVQGLGPAFAVSVTSAATSVRELKALIHEIGGIPANEVRIRSGGHELLDDALLGESAFVSASLRLVAGKGGFGSLLRSGQPGVRVRKVGNDACRDLETGKRMRAVNNERRLAEWESLEEQRQMLLQQEKERMRKEREDAKPKFDDVKYSTELTAIRESVVAAVQDGVKAAMQKQKEEAEKKRKVEETAAAIHPPSKRHGLWNEFDDLPLSDEESDKPSSPLPAAGTKTSRNNTTGKESKNKRSKKNSTKTESTATNGDSKNITAPPKGFLVAKPKKAPTAIEAK